MVKIKSKISEFFAKTDIKVKQMAEDMVKMGNLLFDVQTKTLAPTQKYEAQVFTLSNKFEQSEREREASTE